MWYIVAGGPKFFWSLSFTIELLFQLIYLNIFNNAESRAIFAIRVFEKH